MDACMSVTERERGKKENEKGRKNDERTLSLSLSEKGGKWSNPSEGLLVITRGIICFAFNIYRRERTRERERGRESPLRTIFISSSLPHFISIFLLLLIPLDHQKQILCLPLFFLSVKQKCRKERIERERERKRMNMERGEVPRHLGSWWVLHPFSSSLSFSLSLSCEKKD